MSSPSGPPVNPFPKPEPVPTQIRWEQIKTATDKLAKVMFYDQFPGMLPEGATPESAPEPFGPGNPPVNA
jgi:hypothetical protein